MSINFLLSDLLKGEIRKKVEWKLHVDRWGNDLPLTFVNLIWCDYALVCFKTDLRSTFVYSRVFTRKMLNRRLSLGPESKHFPKVYKHDTFNTNKYTYRNHECPTAKRIPFWTFMWKFLMLRIKTCFIGSNSQTIFSNNLKKSKHF